MAVERPTQEGSEAPLVDSPKPDTSVRSSDARRSPREILHKAAGYAKRKGTALGLSALMLATLKSDSAPRIEPDNTPRPPGIERSVVPLGSLDAVVADLASNPAVNKSETVTDLSSLHRPGDKYEVFTDPLGDVVLGDIDQEPIPTKSLLTITYDKDSRSFQAKDFNIKDIDPNTAYHLLQPVIENTVIETAFANGELDEVVIRMYEPPNDSNIRVKDDGASVINQVGAKYSDILNSGKRMYLFLPQVLNRTDLKYAGDHEGLHAFETGAELGGVRKPEDLKGREDDDRWRAVCDSVRTIAIDQAEQQTEKILTTMESGAQIFSDPKVKAVFNEVHDALERGDFNRFQPSYAEDNPDFQQILPNCQTLGPSAVFVQLYRNLAEREQLGKPNAQEESKMKNLLIKMEQQWQTVIKYNTIYEQLREGYYLDRKGGKNINAGQPHTQWGEGIVSATNLVIQDPETFAQAIKLLPHEEREAALAYIDASVHTMDGLVPQTKENDEYHVLLRMNYNYFRQIAEAS